MNTEHTKYSRYGRLGESKGAELGVQVELQGG
jgi:hypothetical protein